MNSYDGLPVRYLVVDLWDGTAQQCGIFELNAGLSNPMLINGGHTTGTELLFDGATDNLPPWRPETIATAIAAALALLPTEQVSWDQVRAMWR